MGVGSKINQNFPIPGVDQSSRGFRDNFAITKKEIEDLQSKNIQLTGAFFSDPVQIGDGQSDVVIPVLINLANVAAAGSNLAVQYNFNGLISGSTVFYNNGRLGINTNQPAAELHVIGNAIVDSGTGQTSLSMGNVFVVNATAAGVSMAFGGTNAVVIDGGNLTVGIGTAPRARLDVQAAGNSIAIFRGSLNNSDTGIRLTTSFPNATMGLVLEQRSANKVGGIRLDQGGNVSLHANESMDANLSDASAVIKILTNNNVGIGSMAPQNRLDVSGNLLVRGTATVVGNVMIEASGPAGGIVFPDGSYQITASANGGPVTQVVAASIDPTASTYFSSTITGTTAFTFGAPVTQGALMYLRITNGGAYSITWPGSVRWPGATPPSLTASGTDILSFVTFDTGTNWHGAVVSTNSL